MTWLRGPADGASPLERVLALRPDLYDRYRAFVSTFWTEQLLEPVLLELARLRAAQLLGCESEQMIRYDVARSAGLTEELVAALPRWPTSPMFTDAQRAVLAFTEQFVLDPHGVEHAQRDAVIDHCALPGLVALCEALAVFDGLARLRNALALEAPPTTTVVEAPTPAGALW
jgi:alkylhydroperoxidase family enzyme